MKRAFDVDDQAWKYAWEADPTHRFIDWAGRPVTLVNRYWKKNGTMVRSHFRYIPEVEGKGRRLDSYDNMEHEAMVGWFVRELTSKGLQAVPGWGQFQPDENPYGVVHRPDVTFKTPTGELCVIEVQRSRLLVDTLLERTRWYSHMGIHVLWIFHWKLRNSKVVRAYQQKISPLVYFWMVDYDPNTGEPIHAKIIAHKNGLQGDAFVVSNIYTYARGEFLLFSFPYKAKKSPSPRVKKSLEEEVLRHLYGDDVYEELFGSSSDEEVRKR